MEAHANQAARWPLAAIVILIPLLSACDSGPVEPNLESNVTVLTGAEVTTTDDAVLVAGVASIPLGNRPRGMYVQHHTEYTYGGLHQPINNELVGESWYMDVGRSIITRESEDTVFYRYLDFGDVALEGTPALHIEQDTVRTITAGDQVRVYQNHILDRVQINIHRLNLDGSTVSFVPEPFYEHMVGGGAIELTASGSADLQPTSASVTVRPGARVVDLWNGEDLAFDQTRPVLRTDQPLVIELSRSLNPGQSVLRLSYVPPVGSGVALEVLRRASACFQLKRSTDRIVIPAEALAEVASHLPEEEGAFVFRIYEYLVKDDALEIVRVEDGTRQTLSGLQLNSFGFYLRMRR
jgi:hypothetical protein